MKVRFGFKLGVMFLFVTSFLIIVIAIIINYTFEDKFKKYIISIQEQKNQNIVKVLESYYKSVEGDLEIGVIEQIGMKGLEDGLILKITDLNNEIIWDAMDHNEGMCTEMLAEMAKNMKNYYPKFDGKYTITEYALKVNKNKVANIFIGYYGPYYFSENDISFLSAFNNIIFFVGGIAIFFSVFIVIFISKKISKNITDLIEGTKEISNGNYNVRINTKTDIIEIDELIKAVNSLAEDLNNQQNLKNKLTSDIAHEIRTPITTLRSHLEAIKDKIWEITDERVESLYEEIVRIGDIVEGLESLENFEKGNSQLNLTDFDITKTTHKVILNFEKEAIDKNIKFEFDSKSMFIRADKDKIKQVLINLISNSIKYTLNGGVVKIKLLKGKFENQIIVSDNGIGISKKDLPYIFDRFYKVDKSRNRAVKGSGIGLSLVKTIIKLHGGNITVESKLKRGSTFIINLPKNIV